MWSLTFLIILLFSSPFFPFYFNYFEQHQEKITNPPKWVSPPVKPWNACSTWCHFMLLHPKLWPFSPPGKMSSLGVDSSHYWLITRTWIGRVNKTRVYSLFLERAFKKKWQDTTNPALQGLCTCTDVHFCSSSFDLSLSQISPGTLSLSDSAAFCQQTGPPWRKPSGPRHDEPDRQPG